METTVVAFNYVDFQAPRRFENQKIAIQIFAQSPKHIFPVNFGFAENNCGNEMLTSYDIHSFNVLKRNSKTEINNNRSLPYIKEILDFASIIDCEKIGYINSDILIGNEFYEAISENVNAFIFSRKDIAETNPDDFLKGKFKVIYGGDQHIGVDGFFFKRDWWINNRDFFPDDLIVGETEWDTCYRDLIKKYANSYIEKRVLYHVYHDAKWDKTSQGAKNNIKIWNEIT